MIPAVSAPAKKLMPSRTKSLKLVPLSYRLSVKSVRSSGLLTTLASVQSADSSNAPTSFQLTCFHHLFLFQPSVNRNPECRECLPNFFFAHHSKTSRFLIATWPASERCAQSPPPAQQSAHTHLYAYFLLHLSCHKICPLLSPRVP